MFTNECQVVLFKSYTNVVNLALFCSKDNQKHVFIVDCFSFSIDCSVLRSYFGANVILDFTFISNYVRYKECLIFSATESCILLFFPTILIFKFTTQLNVSDHEKTKCL